MRSGSREMQVVGEEGQQTSQPVYFTVLDAWQQTPAARGYINSLLKKNKRKHFGVLERPYEGENKELPILHKKLFLVGRSGVGKTSTVDKLCGRDIRTSHEETVGIQTHTVYWPVKLSSPNVVMLVQLELWDTGERALNKFDHILPTCQTSTDGTLLFFSYEDRRSWDDLPRLMSVMYREDGANLRVVVGTHSDSLQREVTNAEVEQFQLEHAVLVLPIANRSGPRLPSDPTSPDGREAIKVITPFMNTLTQILLAHEQRMQSPFALSLEVKQARLSPDQTHSQ